MFKWFCLITTCLMANNEEEVAKISETMGHLIGKNVQSLQLPIDLDALVKGMLDEASGKPSPLADEEYEQAIFQLQEESHEKAAADNLAAANLFLAQNETQEGIITVEKGKLQYKINASGSGQEVQPYNTPLIRFDAKALNGESLQSGVEEELIHLDEALLGLKLGIAGMKEGEKRTLYIHPDFGYGKESLIPNSLLIFEVEVIKADTNTTDHENRPISS